VKRSSAVAIACALSLVLLSLATGPLEAAQKNDVKKNELQAARYKKWLEEDAVYIITKEERSVFAKLATDEEREQFIEQFWVRRDPDSRSANNEFKEEHYRRIAYANDHFKSGIPGWATDRGRIYILFGPPHEREANVSGGSYERPLKEGGGWTTTYPWERWFYRALPGFPSGVEIEFVDPTLSGEYKIALRKSEKDALFHSEGSGNTIFEEMGLVTRGDRLKADIAMRPLGLGNDSMGMDISQSPFEQIQRYFQLKQPPVHRFDDLRAAVSARITYDQLPFAVRLDTSRVNSESVVVAMTLLLDPGRLAASKTASDVETVSLNIYGQVSALNQKVVAEFDDDTALFGQRSGIATGVYQRKFPVRNGRYKLTLAVRDKGSSRIGSQEVLLLVPGYPDDKLSISPPILANAIRPGESVDSIADGFMTWSGWKVYPALRPSFSASKPVYCYFEIYGFRLDQAGKLPKLNISYRILKDQEVVRRSPESFGSQAANYLRDRVAVLAAIPLTGMGQGGYAIVFDVQDGITGDSNQGSLQFEVTN
jgi:GWxTD domain-containing protein